MAKHTSHQESSLNFALMLLGLMFLLPFISMHHQQPITTFYNEWIAAALGLIALFPLLSLTQWKKIQLPRVSLVFIGLAIILIIQWATGLLHSTQHALLILSYFVWAFSLCILGNYLRRELGWEKLVSSLAWYLVIAGIISVMIVALQIVMRTGGSIPFMPNLSSYGALSQRNQFAVLSVFSTASLIYLYAKGSFSQGFFWLLLTCFLLMLSFAGSRSAWLYLPALYALAFITQRNSVKNHTTSIAKHNLQRVSFWLIPVFILVQLFIYYAVPSSLIELPTERMIDGMTASTTSERVSIWYDSLRMFFQSPWLGVGIGEMRAESFLLLDHPTAMAFKRVFEHAHNLFLHLLAEMGIGAFLIVSIGLIVWIRTFIWRELNLETWWLLCILSVLGIHSLLEYPLWFTYFLGITAILLGAGDEKTYALNRILSADSRRKLAHVSFTLIFLLGMINLGTLFIANMKLEKWVEKYMYENINEQNLPDWVRQNSLLSAYADLLTVMSMPVNIQNINEKVLLSESVLLFKPLRKITYQHALLLELQGDHAGAVKQLNRALIAYPINVENMLEYAPAEYKQNYLTLLYETRPELKATNEEAVN